MKLIMESREVEVHPVESSQLSAVGYDGGELFVVFKTDTAYQYEGVTPLVYVGLRNAESKGSYLNQEIKRKQIPYKKLGFVSREGVDYIVSQAKLIEVYFVSDGDGCVTVLPPPLNPEYWKAFRKAGNGTPEALVERSKDGGLKGACGKCKGGLFVVMLELSDEGFGKAKDAQPITMLITYEGQTFYPFGYYERR